ncbi:MAG TPA: hypothetical protein VKH44_11735, partial [Pirellulaceae bacterium]|nr:hypothetical protein [Pirellulaceae bacterium]
MSDQDNLEKRFHEGLCLAAGGDFDQANGAFLDCVIGEPGCGEFVQEFLGNLGRRFPAGSGGEAPQGSDAEPVQRAAAQADWIEVLRRAPRLLADHPWHTPTLLALAEACAAQGYAKAEGCYLRAA